MRMPNRIALAIDDYSKRELERIARTEGVSMSEILRRSVWEALARDRIINDEKRRSAAA